MGISEQLETPQERSETVFCDKSEATGVNEEAQGSPPGKRPPGVDCAVKYRFWCRAVFYKQKDTNLTLDHFIIETLS